MKKKDDMNETLEQPNEPNEHSLICHEGLFYEGLRAIAEDTEKK